MEAAHGRERSGEMTDEFQALRDENKRMRDALISILRTGPIGHGYGGPGCSYKTLHLMHLREAVKGLGCTKFGGSYQGAWQQVIDRGWAEK